MPYDITYMWNRKYDTNELIYKTKQTHRQKINCGYQRGRRGRVGINEEFGISRYKLLYIKQISNKTLQRELYSISCDKL